MGAFFDTCDIDKKMKTLITIINLKGKRRSSFLDQNSEIIVIDANQIIKVRLPHNRYIILFEDKNKYTVWQLPSSIDYIRFSEKSILPETTGIIQDSVSFNQVSKTMLKNELRTFIESEI